MPSHYACCGDETPSVYISSRENGWSQAPTNEKISSERHNRHLIHLPPSNARLQVVNQRNYKTPSIKKYASSLASY